jgi:ABC-type oligopeptide transport system substrate-binding subunit
MKMKRALLAMFALVVMLGVLAPAAQAEGHHHRHHHHHHHQR